MEKFKIKLVKWLANRFGFKIAMIKMGNGKVSIQGDKELLQYCDISGYTFKKDPIKRTNPKFTKPEPIKPLTVEQLKELKLTIKNINNDLPETIEEASKVQDQIINGDVKINIVKK